MPVASLSDRYAAQIRGLYAASGADRWNVPLEYFITAVAESLDRRFAGQTPREREIVAYLAGLAVADMALACGCRLGREAAWDHFVLEFRPVLYAAGRAIAGEAGRELADALYADLFGTTTDRPDRRSLFAYYHGRSSLATWLRAVLARRHVDRLREQARTETLAEDREHPASRRAAGLVPPPDPERARFVRLAQDAIDAAIAALPAGDRLRLRLYYGEGLTLAEIGRTVHEHEATVSRKLSRLKRDLRHTVVRVLRTSHGLDDASVAACFDHAADAPELHLSRLLSSEDG